MQKICKSIPTIVQMSGMASSSHTFLFFEFFNFFTFFFFFFYWHMILRVHFSTYFLQNVASLIVNILGTYILYTQYVFHDQISKTNKYYSCLFRKNVIGFQYSNTYIGGSSITYFSEMSSIFCRSSLRK